MTSVQNIAYGNIYTGERQGVTSALQLPDQSCRLVTFIAPSDNVTQVYLGGSGVTVAAGSDTLTAGYELQPGAQTHWWPILNLNQVYMICDATTDDLLWVALE